jgi:type II secretory pathway component PulF
MTLIQSAYKWKGLRTDGQLQYGRMDAPTKNIAREKIHSLGINRILSLHRSFEIIPSKNTLTLTQLEQFFASLHRLFSAGIPLTACLMSIKENAPSQALREFADVIYNKISLGRSLSSAIKASGIAINAAYFALLRTGETSGKLEAVIEAIHQLLAKRLALRKKVMGALMYPLCILIISLFILCIFFIVIIPQFKSIYDKSQHELPYLTQLLIHISDHFFLYSLSLFTCFIIIFFSIRHLYQRHTNIKNHLQQALLKVPIFSRIITLQQQHLLAFNLQLCLQAGITLEKSLLQASESSFLIAYQQSLKAIIRWVSSGRSLSSAIKAHPLLPPAFTYLLQMAEQSGSLDMYFAQLNTELSQQLDQWIQNLSQLFEPFIIVVLGSMIGFIVVAMYLPIFELGRLF